MISGRLVAVAAALALLPTAAPAQDGLFAGKTVTIIVGFGAGGGYDLYARLLARHYGAHLPGHPSFVVQNMDGAGSLRAANYVYGVAPRDGTVIAAVDQNIPIYPLLGGKGAQFDPASLEFLGSAVYSNGIVYSWAASGIASLADARTREVPLGAAGASSDSYTHPIMINHLLGTRFKPVNGYGGSQEIDLAIERGEMIGRAGATWASLLAGNRAWIESGKIALLVQIGIKKEPDLPGVPLLIDLVSGEAERQMVTILSVPTAIGKVHWMAPGVPPERLAILRAGYDATLQDPAFLADAAQHSLPIRAQTAGEVAALVRQAAATPPAVLERTTEILGRTD